MAPSHPTDSPTSAQSHRREPPLDAPLPDYLRATADGDLPEYARDSLIGIHPDQDELRGWAVLMEAAADEIERLASKAVETRQGVQNMLDGNYPHPRTYRPHRCPHGASYYEECPSCNDAALQAILAKADGKGRET